MPTVTVTDTQRQYAKGFLTGSVVYATNGEALGSICVYDQKGQVVRSVRKGLGGLAEDVSTAYTFTGAVDNTEARVNVGYGSDLIAQTGYDYSYGKKTQMTMSLSHGAGVKSASTQYSYDNIGRLSGKRIPMTSTNWIDYTYSYDVHNWLTGISSLGFSEKLFYADGLENAYYNGNISTIKWSSGDNNYQGYNLEYDDCNRLSNATFGGGNNLTNNRGYFNEIAEYDENGNITRLQRRGLVDHLHGGFGLVDDLYMTYSGNQLTSVRDNASQLAYAGATDFNGVRNQEYPLTYNESGSLVSDAGRNIANIEYDNLNNPVRIQFTNGNVTKYVYSAAGEKLRVIYQTAVPNITVAMGSTRELTPSETLYTDSLDYLLGGALTLRNGRIDKFQFDEGYCQAERYTSTKDDFTFCYYDTDHLGNVRQVTELDGSRGGNVIQRNNYYPFGAEFCDNTASNSVQSRKYNGKEFDNMHGLNTYDYGARQYNPVTARWDRVDRYSEKYYSINPYAYCANNPINFIDINGDSIYVAEQYRKDFLDAISPIFGGFTTNFEFSQSGMLSYNGNSQGMSKDQKILLNGLMEVMDDEHITEFVFLEEGNDLTEVHGGAYTILDDQNRNYVYIDLSANNTFSVLEVTQAFYDYHGRERESQMNQIKRFRSTIVKSNTCDRVFHEFGHLIYDGRPQSLVIDYNNLARKILRLPKRKYDEEHNKYKR